jgi:DNA-binding transcriptional LysR family regulator
VAPVVNAFLAKYATVQVELTLLDRTVDLVEEGLDVGVRIGQLPDSSLVALPAGQTRRVVCASPAYLKRAGTPRVPADLAAHRSVSFNGVTPGHEWTFAVPEARAGGRSGTTGVTMRPSLATNQIDPALAACVDGAGVGRFLCYQVRAALATRKLRRLLREFEPAPLPIHVVYPHARLLSGNVRAFVDFALPRLRALGVGAD